MEKEKAIVLKCTKFRESDLVVTFLTSQGEQLSLLARGALRSKKRFGGGLLEPSHYLQINYVNSKKDHGMGSLSEASMIKDFSNLRVNYDALIFALKVLELIKRVSREGEKAPEIFFLLGHTLQSLSEVSDLGFFKLHFYLRLLNQQGVLAPELWMKSLTDSPIHDHLKLSKAFSGEARTELKSKYLSRLETRAQNYADSGC